MNDLIVVNLNTVYKVILAHVLFLLPLTAGKFQTVTAEFNNKSLSVIIIQHKHIYWIRANSIQGKTVKEAQKKTTAKITLFTVTFFTVYNNVA